MERFDGRVEVSETSELGDLKYIPSKDIIVSYQG